MAEAHTLARKLAAKSPEAVSRAKRSMYAVVGRPLDEALAVELEQQLAFLETDDALEALRAFMERR